MSQMPKYQSHKIISALKIKTVAGPNGCQLTFEEIGFEPIILEALMTARYRPKPGDYYIVYEDGYKSISPAKAFEDGYRRI